MESVKLESIETKSTASDNSSTKKSMASSKDSLCTGKTKKGLPCSYKAAKGETTCKIHSNQSEIITVIENPVISINTTIIDPVIIPLEITSTKSIRSIIDQSLLGMHNNDSLLNTVLNGTQTLKTDLHIIISSVDKSISPLKAVIVSALAKIIYPDWDTRNHQTGLGGKSSLRTIDHRDVCPYLYAQGLYPTATEFALTRSFEKAEPYTMAYTGAITPKPCKSAFLNIVHSINETYSEALCRAILCYCLQYLKDKKIAKDALRGTIVVIKCGASLKTVQTLLNNIFTSATSGIAVIPPIAMWAVCITVQPFLWPGCSIKPLKEHTAADGNSKAYGDVEGYGPDAKPFLAIEVKHCITIDPTIIATFEEKTGTIPLRFIVTTKDRRSESTDTNIIISTVTDAIIHMIQLTLFHKKEIIVEYIDTLRKAIMEYKNISLTAQEAIVKIFTEVIV